LLFPHVRAAGKRRLLMPLHLQQLLPPLHPPPLRPPPLHPPPLHQQQLP